MQVVHAITLYLSMYISTKLNRFSLLRAVKIPGNYVKGLLLQRYFNNFYFLAETWDINAYGKITQFLDSRMKRRV